MTSETELDESFKLGKFKRDDINCSIRIQCWIKYLE